MANTAPCTPPSESKPQLVPDTSSVLRLASRDNCRTGVPVSLERQAVLKDLGKYLKLPYATLIRSVFGDIPLDTSSVRQRLVDEGVLNRASDTTTSQWSEFTVSPAQSNSSESLTFAPLVHLISSVFNQVSDCQLFAAASPSTTPVSEREDTFRSDAYIIDKRPAAKEKRDIIQNRIHWFDIAITFGFKKVNEHSSRHENKEKIIWCLHRIMREDPLRRFALGITIEDTEMRLWCHSRALLAVSEPINFLKSVDDIISLFYLIGNLSEVQLGWDPTVKRIHVDNKFQYEFKVNDETFTTTRPLATFGADVMISRGTRVYEAYDANGNLVAIKDSWRDEDRDPEGAILEKIFEDIRKNFEKEEAEKAMKYFVAIRVYGDVVISGEIDKTFTLKLEEGDAACLQWITVDAEPLPPERRHLSSTGHILGFPDSVGLSMEDLTDFQIPGKIHGRTVFKDVGHSLVGLTRLSNNVTCLSGAQKALYYLHKAGWVHRDFSVANVLWVDPEGIGKLSDFEFAKRVDSTVSHDVRTGTMNFMAIEVEAQAYMFVPQDIRYSPPAPPPPFRTNFLHDLESLWWSAVWVLMYHTDKDSPTENPGEQSKSFKKAFTHSAPPTLSGTYRDACSDVFDLASTLHGFYKEAEVSYPIIRLENNLLEEAHKKVSDALSNVAKKLGDSGVHLIPLYKFAEKKRDPSDSPTQQAKKKARKE